MKQEGRITQRQYDVIQSLCLMDNFFMKICFEGHNECVELMIRIILGRDDLFVLSSSIQENLTGPEHEVVLDIFARDSEGRKYNIEFQRADKGAVPERARYHGSMIDVRSLKKGDDDYSHLPEVYVIFITEHDVLNGGLPLYTIDRVIQETGEKFGDKSHIIYVNTSHKDRDTALGKLINDLLAVNPDDMNYGPLVDRARDFKDKSSRPPKEVKEVNEVLESYVQERIAEAMNDRQKDLKKEKESFALRMLQAGKLALDEIVEYSGLSMAAVKRLAKALKTDK